MRISITPTNDFGDYAKPSDATAWLVHSCKETGEPISLLASYTSKEEAEAFVKGATSFSVATAVSGSTRGLQINRQTYWIKPNRSVEFGPGVTPPGQDAWVYVLPNGERFTHPEKFGALLMCLKHAGGDEWAEWE